MLVFVTTVVTVATHHGSGNDNELQQAQCSAGHAVLGMCRTRHASPEHPTLCIAMWLVDTAGFETHVTQHQSRPRAPKWTKPVELCLTACLPFSGNRTLHHVQSQAQIVDATNVFDH